MTKDSAYARTDFHMKARKWTGLLVAVHAHGPDQVPGVLG
jgi:hypothetical protein